MIALAGAVLLLAGCGQNTDPGASPVGKTFLSTSVTEDGKPKQLAPKTRVRLQFTDDGRLVADAGCNSMQSKVSTKDGKLALDGELASTAMGCPGPQQGQDSWLAGIISAKPTWKLDGNKLDVTAGSTTISLENREILEPDLPLDGTRWILSSVISGDSVGHFAGSENVWLTLNGERVTGSTGCNDFQGVVARSTGKLTFGELATTRRACAGNPATLESQVLKGLKGEMTYHISGATLQLRSANGGLDFTAVR
ncbi:META domain-containing protein [Kribbella sp. NPDC058693]|uniref:META domain-containing protein n=1 Tax=Kribbella sp. NPDC058693 TaxID=3346602 RepID=UPI00366196EA